MFVNVEGREWDRFRSYALLNAPDHFSEEAAFALRSIGLDFDLYVFHCDTELVRIIDEAGSRDLCQIGRDLPRFDSVVGWWPANPASIDSFVSLFRRLMFDGLYCIYKPLIDGLVPAEAELLSYQIHVVASFPEYFVCKTHLNQWEQQAQGLGQRPSPTNSIPGRALSACRRRPYLPILTTQMTCPPVQFFGQRLEDVPLHHTTYTSRLEAGVSDLGSVTLFNDTCMLITADDEIAEESKLWVDFSYAADYFTLSKETDWRIWKRSSITPNLEIDEPVVIAGVHAQNNYYHLLNDLAPKFWLIDKARELEFLPEDTVILVPTVGSSRVRDDFLEKIESVSGPVRRLTTGVTAIRHALFPALRDERYETHLKFRARPSEFYSWLKRFGERFVVDETFAAEFVYIARPDTGKRRLVNEPEVMAMLTDMGFSIVNPGMLSLAEQISVMRRARLVIGPHGAGLFNFQWALIDATLVEIKSAVNTDLGFRFLAQMRGSTYNCIEALPVVTEGQDLKDADVVVDLEQFRRFIHEKLGT
jgi:capsular polysaccharide biosynthesis protein